jgi:hypothetical protein
MTDKSNFYRYPNIIDFLKVRETCLFCGATLWCRLTNFSRHEGDDLPILNAPLKDNFFTFSIDHTTPDYTVRAEGNIDIRNNLMLLQVESPAPESSTPVVDVLVANQTFFALQPHIQLYCPKKDCPQQYTVASDVLKVDLSDERWLIRPFSLFYESFVTGTLWVGNDYLQNATYIESIKNDSANPIMVPLMDFQAMGSKKLLLRAKTIAIFN